MATKLLGTQAHPQLSTKAADTAGALPLCVALVANYAEKLGLETTFLQSAGECLVRYHTLLRGQYQTLTTGAIHDRV